MKPFTLASMFMYKTRLESEKVQRRAAYLRSSTAGAKRKHSMRQAEAEVPLIKSCDNKGQLQLMLQQAHANASAMQARRGEYFSRKGNGVSIGKAVRLEQLRESCIRRKVAERIVAALQRTCYRGPKGGYRKPPPTDLECQLLLPHPDAPRSTARGNQYKSAARKKRGYKLITARRQERQATRRQLARSRPLNSRERNKAEGNYAMSQVPKPLTKAQLKRKLAGDAGRNAAASAAPAPRSRHTSMQGSGGSLR